MNIIAYLEWRGDISITNVPLCEADYAVLASCSYLPFDGVVPSGFEEKAVNLWNAVNEVKRLTSLEGDGRSYHYKEDNEMVEKLLSSPRFIRLDLTGFINKIDEENEEQFSAVTFILPNKQIVIAFRGTDRTLTGWKEDFNMVYLDKVPSQADALKYLEEAADSLEGDIYVCGHSKGGNLAVYASAFCSEKVKSRIKKIVSMDGPGFDKEKIMSPEFLSIKDKMYSFIPQQSIVGMLLEHLEEHSVIHSSGAAFGQHSIYTWEIRRGEFIREDNIKNMSRKFDATMKNWFLTMDNEKREKIVEGFWRVVEGSGVNNIEDLFTFKSAVNMLRSMGKIDDETKDDMSEAVRLFRNAHKKMRTDNREIRKTNRRKKKEPETGL